MLFNYLTKAKTPIDFAGSTHGILVGNFNIEVEENQTVNVNLWDFGGQEYYHATHRLFFSDNVLYLLLWEQETDKYGSYTFTSEQDTIISQQGLQYFNPPISTEITTEGFPVVDWVSNIRFFSKESPILLIQNKTDIQEPKYKFSELEEDIPHTRVSLKKLEGINELKKLIKSSIQTLKHYKYKIPVSWQKVIEFISSLGNNYFGIGYDSLEREFRSWNQEIIDDLPQILNFYHERGDILWIKNNELLKKYIFPQPWRITNTIYSILNRKVADKDKGEFTRESIYSLYGNQKEHVDFCLELMKEFEIIFSIKNEDEIFIAPQYLNEKIQDEKRLEDNIYYTELQKVFTLYYPTFMPKSIFTRFICNYGIYADKMMYGKEEIYFAKNKIGSYVTCDYDKKVVTVNVQNQDNTLTREIFEELYRISDEKDNLQLYSEAKNRFVSLSDIREYSNVYKNEFHFIFKNSDLKPPNNKFMTEEFEKAKQHLKSKEYDSFFDEMDKMEIPPKLQPPYSIIRNLYFNTGKVSDSRLEMFMNGLPYFFENNSNISSNNLKTEKLETKSIQTVKIFLASSSELIEERKLMREVFECRK